MDGRGITGLLLAVTIGAVFFVPVVDVLDQSTGDVEIENETVTNNAQFDEIYDLQAYEIEPDSETLEVWDDGTESWVTLTAGTDYEIDNEQGTIEFIDGGEVTEGDEVRASYIYQATDGIVTSIAGLLPVFLALLLLVPMANKVSSEV